jgi:hypothetical protein
MPAWDPGQPDTTLGAAKCIECHDTRQALVACDNTKWTKHVQQNRTTQAQQDCTEITILGSVCGGGGTCTDNDGDGFGNPGDASCPNGAATDCDDTDSNIYPGAGCGGTVDYTNDIQPIFTNNCITSKCHDNNNPKAGLDLSPPALNSYNNLLANDQVVPGDRNASQLYQKVSSGSMADELTPAEAEQIGVWINEGASSP